MAEKLKITSVGSGLTLVFIHGWGLNSAVWQPTVEQLKQQNYQLIMIDLPGFGINAETTVTPYTIENVAQAVVQSIGQPAIYIGWSLGGLVATEIASKYLDSCLGLISVASSPLFRQSDDWPGIKSELLTGFHQQLADNIEKTIKGFLKIQAMGSPHLRQDIKLLQSLIMQHPLPSQEILDSSLSLLECVDLRNTLSDIQVPFLRLYGRLDSLVPNKIISLVNELSPASDVHIFDKASHAPFISHPEEFTQVVNKWIKAKHNG